MTATSRSESRQKEKNFLKKKESKDKYSRKYDLWPEDAFGTTGVEEQTQSNLEGLSERAAHLANVSPSSPIQDPCVSHKL